jgi:hypothetical protein
MSTKNKAQAGTRADGKTRMSDNMTLPYGNDSVKPEFPGALQTIELPDAQLRGAAVLARSVIDAELVADELKALLVGTRKAFLEHWEIIKVLGDFLLEFSEKKSERAWLDRRIKSAEREAARLRVPVWFWRRPEGTVREALVTRAQWMREEGYLPDDIFDLLKEYLQHIDEDRVTDAQLVTLIERAKGGDCADS